MKLFFQKLRLIVGVVWFLVFGKKPDTHSAFTVEGNPKFMGPRDAVALIKDGDFLCVSGLASNQHATIMHHAICEVFGETGHPSQLTIMAIGGVGSRGRVSGSIDDLNVEGLCTRFITGHTETFKGALTLADEGKLELQCIPQGEPNSMRLAVDNVRLPLRRDKQQRTVCPVHGCRPLGNH